MTLSELKKNAEVLSQTILEPWTDPEVRINLGTPDKSCGVKYISRGFDYEKPYIEIAPDIVLRERDIPKSIVVKTHVRGSGVRTTLKSCPSCKCQIGSSEARFCINCGQALCKPEWSRFYKGA